MKTLPDIIEDAIAAMQNAGAALATAREVEQQLEDERPFVKRAAILRLMSGTNELTQKPHSASSAEAVVETDSEYAGYRKQQRDAVVRRMHAEATRDALRLRATALVNIAGELVEAA